MKQSFLFIFLLTFVLSAIGQVEQILPLQYNTKLYYESLPYQNKSEFIDRNVIITTDTLSIPFVDDFSSNTLRPFSFNTTNVYDTILFANGTCVINQNFDFVSQRFHTDSSYTYTYNTTTNELDSVANLPVVVTTYSNANCFDAPTSTMEYWLPYYIYTADDFDPNTGERLDSTLALADTTMDIATIYFADYEDDGVNWMDNYAYWNTTYPVLPITIGVATLDGLNEFGSPYNNDVINAFGDADLLTSKPIDLSDATNDSAVYLSFYFQAQGLGDNPNQDDSLVVEFRNEFDGGWIPVWSVSAVDLTSNDFQQAYIPVRDTNLIVGPKYFYEEFQFRFRNKASISGNNDHWHIDYVRLDKNRALANADSVIRDVAFLYDFPSYLENYTLLPWRQFQAGADTLMDSISVPIRDNGQSGGGPSTGSFPIDVSVGNSVTPDIFYSISGQVFNATQEVKYQDFFPSSDFTIPFIDADSVCSQATMIMAPTDRNLLLVNDTIHHEICYSNVMAYDDGSAERAYGIEGGSPNEVKKFAYEFEVAQTDTLAAIQIHFTNIDEDVSNLVFSLNVWDSIEIGNVLAEEVLLGTIENQKPAYIDMRNGFATFVFDTAITVSGKFYVGWSQLDSRNLQIGYDLNSTRGREHMFVQTDNQWLPSGVVLPGSPMIRVILDGDYPLATPIRDYAKEEKVVHLYPNPAKDLLYFNLPNDLLDFEVVIYNLSGQVVSHYQNTNQLDVSGIQNGYYLFQLIDKRSGAVYHNKFIKSK